MVEHPAGFVVLCAQDDDMLAGSKLHGCACGPRLAPAMETATAGPAPSSSPRCATLPERTRPAAAAGAKGKRTRAAVFGSIEEYEETCRLGEGGFGTVAKARHRATGQTVAIKRLDATDGGDDREEELLREARFLEACRGNPFVVGFRGVVRDPATAGLRLVMECVGPCITDFLLRRGSPPVPESTLRTVMWQLLTGAKKMHELGIIHRDIKPENILVADDLRSVKICDFGLAMSMSEAPPYDPAGTFGYQAPEILLEMPEYDARVDTWSLGCVMAEIITGKELFEAYHPDEELLAIFRVLGVPDNKTWPEFWSTPFAAEWLPELDVRQPNVLRELVTEAMLSDEGFEVLSSLLACNPDKRLTAAAALEHQWFAKEDALELPKKEEVASALPKQIDHPASPKRQKLMCV